jgi:N-acetylmuramoyl-L-alanine amidase
VGLQVGHWKIEDHPAEQIKLRKFSGAYYGGYDEWELNILIAEQVQQRLEAAGVTVELLPATIPPGYQADLFVSIHVDGVTGDAAAVRRGWKVATPFGASLAAEALAAAIAESYPAATGLPPDSQGPSYDMRAYYAFASYRYWHSVAPTTPSVIVECGFMTHLGDREVLFDHTDLVGAGIADGILAYLQAYHPASAAQREPVGLAMLRPATAGVPLRARADSDSSAQLTLAPGQALVQVARAEGWLLVFTHGGDWDLGWLREDEVVPLDEPLEPPFPCCGE